MPINIKFIDFSLFYMLLLHAFDISFCNYKIATYYIFIPVYLLWVYCDFCKFVKEHFAQDWETRNKRARLYLTSKFNYSL